MLGSYFSTATVFSFYKLVFNVSFTTLDYYMDLMKFIRYTVIRSSTIIIYH